jgi:hypothetical protein
MLKSSKIANVIEMEQTNEAFGSAVWTKGPQRVEIHHETICNLIFVT